MYVNEWFLSLIKNITFNNEQLDNDKMVNFILG